MNNSGIIDISLGISKKRFRIDGDDNKIIELNTSDFNIVSRLNDAYPKLQECDKKAQELAAQNATRASDTNRENAEEIDFEDLDKFSTALKDVDSEMKALIDYIFDSNVSEICAGNGSMYDIINGYARYEIIINALTDLYSDNLSAEMAKVQARANQHIQKYTKKK